MFPEGCRERAAQDVSGQGRRSGDHRQLIRTRDMTMIVPQPRADRKQRRCWAASAWPASVGRLHATGMGEPVAGDTGFDDLAVEGETVDDGRAEPGVGEGLGPAGERLVGGDRDGGLLFAFGEGLEQQFGAAPVQFHIAELVEQKKVDAAHSASACVPRESPSWWRAAAQNASCACVNAPDALPWTRAVAPGQRAGLAL
jgi:hypothetical protein